MKTLSCLIIILALPAFAADQAPSCSANFTEMKSILDSKAKTFKSTTDEVRDEAAKVVSQSAVLKSKDVTVTFKIGGCEHVVYSFTFENVKTKASASWAVFAAAESLMESTATVKGDKKKGILLDALEKGKVAGLKTKDAKTFELPCGSAHCLLDAQENGRLVLSYDQAL